MQIVTVVKMLVVPLVTSLEKDNCITVPCNHMYESTTTMLLPDPVGVTPSLFTRLGRRHDVGVGDPKNNHEANRDAEVSYGQRL